MEKEKNYVGKILFASFFRWKPLKNWEFEKEGEKFKNFELCFDICLWTYNQILKERILGDFDSIFLL